MWTHVITILSFLAYLPRSKHLHIASAAFNVWFGRTGPGRQARDAALRRSRHPRGGHPLRRRHRRRPDLEGDARHLLLHRVRPLPGRVPGVCHRQDAVAQAGDHGTARPGVRRRRGAGDRPRPGGDGGPAAAQRSDLTALVPSAVPEESVWDCVTCGACVQACPVSIEHVDHIVDLRRHLVMVESSFPVRGRADAARRRALVEPLGQGAVRARRLGRRPRHPDPRAGRDRARVPVLGRLRELVRRARPPHGREHGEAAAEGRASTSRSSAPARPAPATRRGGSATSTCSRRSPSRTWRRSTRPA